MKFALISACLVASAQAIGKPVSAVVGTGQPIAVALNGVCKVTYNSGADKYQVVNKFECDSGLVCSSLVEIGDIFVGVCDAVAKDGEECKVTYNSGADKYQGVTGFKCDRGLVCSGFDDNGNDGEIFTGGVCKSESCDGTADPDATQDTGTIRVTICHRTCSETNPWVRITIDDDAWGGADAEGCGHRQHNIEDECSKYGVVPEGETPWAAWGKNHQDYELKVHGTRDTVRINEGFTNTADEKAYWREWEHACPYVRGEACCSWEDGSCCGINPAAALASVAAPVAAPVIVATEPEPNPQSDPQSDAAATKSEPDTQPDLQSGPCVEDESACFSRGKPCTGREDECCDGLGCYGYNFYKVCKETPDCLDEWHDCSGSIACCDGMECVPTDTGMFECETPTIGRRNLRQARQPQDLHASS
jgi:hypothetical protein